ncbi:hypothetical protein WJX72_004708 [[Myrmecia] bisecta]|uniref:Cytidyltransferase-like domain-containing protein n=1 Tax=[Myrmecia] bisecta TaxID=41462 RepID=A0AAW1Q0R4_9CHLO
MEADTATTIEAIHKSRPQAVVYATGGGMQALSWLLTMPGASNTILDARVPYATKAMGQVLSSEPATSASVETASDMARAAYKQAADLAAFGTPLMGIGCTCALATNRPKKGEHKVYAAIHSGAATTFYSLTLEKGARNRLQEDAVASRLLIRAIADGCHLPEGRSLDLALREQAGGAADAVEHVAVSEEQLGDPLEALLAGRVQTVEFSGGQVVVDAPRRGRIYLAGSFNPLHEGHRGMLAAACQTLARDPADCCYELSVGNPDKGVLPIDEVRRRLQPFLEEGLPVVITKASLFTQKAALFRDSVFVIGYDTAVRLVMPKYYGGEADMLVQFAGVHHHGSQFVVVGRVNAEGRFLSLEDMEVPHQLQDWDLFRGVPESAFRNDISSTALRQSANSQPS